MACLTKSQSDLLIREIDILLDSLYQSNPRPEIRESTLREYELRKVQESDNTKLLNTWKKELVSARVLKLELAFDPNETSLKKLWSWANQNISKNIVLDITYDPSLVAGTVISWNGKYRDYSQKAQLNTKIFESVWKTLKNT